MSVLDDLSGFEFEDVMEDVFRKQGFENVRQAPRTADEGRDVLMEEIVDGERRAVVVECKHQDVVGRPVVQKLHSAISTFDYEGPKRGIVVTTGRFAGTAQEYADRLRATNDPYPIDLLDGGDLRSIADDVGLDLYNGRIEILCDEALRAYNPSESVYSVVREAFAPVENIRWTEIPDPAPHVEFRPIVVITARTDAVFETTVGVIHRINDQSAICIHADQNPPTVANNIVAELILNNLSQTVDVAAERYREPFESVAERRFEMTETEYKEWAIDRLREHHSTTVHYTGDNNVDYSKKCVPKKSDISIRAIEAVYVPEVSQNTNIMEYEYTLDYFAAGPSRAIIQDGIRRCVHCSTSTNSTTYTFCDNCGSINCPSHTKMERVEDTPICTGCAVTEQFFLKTKYFYDEENLEAFRKEYEEMPLHEKAMENQPLAVFGVVAAIATMFWILGSIGVI